MSEALKLSLRHILERATSLVLAGIVISLVIIAVLLIVSRGSQQAQRDANDRTEKLLQAIQVSAEKGAATNRALGCAWLLPTKPLPQQGPDVVGRDVKDGIACWTDEGLEPPSAVAGS